VSLVVVPLLSSEDAGAADVEAFVLAWCFTLA